MKCTLCITQICNLVCDYCYIGKRKATMSLPVAQRIIDFAFEKAALECPDEPIHFGFFGGEPLVKFELVKAIARLIRAHPSYDPGRVDLMVVTNGTLYSEEIAEFLAANDIGLGISCDGIPVAHDTFRRFANGRGSSSAVEKTIKSAVQREPRPLVNAVYHPRTFRHLPDTIEYFSSLGLRQIYLNPDYSARWSEEDVAALPEIYERIADLYVDYYLEDDPHFISLIDSKIAVILRNGYGPQDRCRMGKAEFAFTPEGHVYPCERLIGAGLGDSHCIGNVKGQLNSDKIVVHVRSDGQSNAECKDCSLKDYCMNWCGCSNYFATGYYNRVNAFQCMSEKAAISTAFSVFQQLEARLGPVFCEHLSGQPSLNSVCRRT